MGLGFFVSLLKSFHKGRVLEESVYAFICINESYGFDVSFQKRTGEFGRYIEPVAGHIFGDEEFL